MCIMRGHQRPAAAAVVGRPAGLGEPVRGAGPCGTPDGLPMRTAALIDPGRPGLLQACLGAVLRRARQAHRVSPDSASATIIALKREPV